MNRETPQVSEGFSDHEAEHKRRNWVGALLTVVVLALIGLLAGRILYFVYGIQNGGLTEGQIQFFSDYTPDDRLSNLPLPDGTINATTQDDPSLGESTALVKIVEFADFGCPYSRSSSFVVRALARQYADNVFYQYRDFPLDELHPGATLAAQASECAREQEKFWEFHDKLYLHQTDLSRERFLQFAQELNLHVTRFSSCLDSGRYAKEVEEDYLAGLEAGVRGTPTFFINGNRIAGAIPEAIFEKLIQGFAR